MLNILVYWNYIESTTSYIRFILNLSVTERAQTKDQRVVVVVGVCVVSENTQALLLLLRKISDQS